MKNINYREILEKMTLEEKASICSGSTFWLTQPIERLGVPSVWVSDGPNGLRKESQTAGTNLMRPAETATCFPTSATTANSWDVDLVEAVGAAISEEAKALNVTTVLGPGVNIKRSPLCGRNFEYFSEDPYLSGRLGAAFVHGIQKNNIGVSLKHFAANNQEHLRMSIDSVVDERALREIYLSAFEYVVKTEQPKTVMCSYNRLNGEYLAENKRLLTDILREEWGFENIVVSDWGAVNDRVKGVEAGLDLEMPSNNGMNDKRIVAAVRNGSLSMEALDKCVLRMLKFVFESKEYECPGCKMDFSAHHEISRNAAANSAVLLKNTDGALPLKKEQSVAVIGALAKQLRYQGAGSSHINPPKTVSFVEAMQKAGRPFTYADGYSVKGNRINMKLIDKACEKAKGKDAVLVFIGLTDAYESEGFDREHINLPEAHNILMNRLAEVNSNLIVVLAGGSPVKISQWEPDAKAILNMYLSGQAGGEAAYDLIYGKVNPSGKLAETYPLHNSDNLVAQYFPMGPRTVEYRESVYVGYRYFDAAKKAVAYPFGFGLSYTSFEYSALKLSARRLKEGKSLTVSFSIKNTGELAGAEVAQVYVSDVESTVFRPVKELKGFAKVFLEPGEEKTVEIELDSRAFSYYNVLIKDWHIESGDFKILVGASSADIRLEGKVNVTSANPDAPLPDYRESAPSYYRLDAAKAIPDSEFSALYGAELIKNTPFEKGSLSLNNSVEQVACGPFGKALYGVMKGGARLVSLTAENPDMIIRSVTDMPLRSFSGFTGGLISQKSVDGLVDLCNGKKGGFKKLCSGFKKENR